MFLIFNPGLMNDLPLRLPGLGRFNKNRFEAWTREGTQIKSDTPETESQKRACLVHLTLVLIKMSMIVWKDPMARVAIEEESLNGHPGDQ